MDPSEHSFLKSRFYKYLEDGIRDASSTKVRICAYNQLMNLYDPNERYHGKCISTNSTNTSNTVTYSTKDNKTIEKERLSILDAFWQRLRYIIHEQGLKDECPEVVYACILYLNVMLCNDMLSDEDGDCILTYIFSEYDIIRESAAIFIYMDTFDADAVTAVLTKEETKKQKIQKLKAIEIEKNRMDDDECKDDSEDVNQIRVRIEKQQKMRDDVIQLIQLVKDRSIDYHFQIEHRLQYLQNIVNEKSSFCGFADDFRIVSDVLYRYYVQVADHVVHCMVDKLPVLTVVCVLCVKKYVCMSFLCSGFFLFLIENFCV